MYFTSLKLLKLCAKHQAGVNFTTLMEGKAPRLIQLLFIITYLLLLYSLVAAYTTQGASLIATVSEHHITRVPSSTLVFILIFGLIIISQKLSDYSNRFFIGIKFIFFTLTIITLMSFVNWHYSIALPVSFSAIVFAWPTLLPSFGFQNIVPVLYEYQQGDVAAIKRSILIGSLLVLFIYIIWVFICLSILPQTGAHSYSTLFHQGNTLSKFTHSIQTRSHNHFINSFLSIFINVSILTSFICCGLSLLHYIKDTFKKFNRTIPTSAALLLTYLPPFIFTVFYPKGFVLALQYASIFAVIIFVYTPLFLGDEKLYLKKNLYALVLGSLVIVAQLFNLAGVTQPF